MFKKLIIFLAFLSIKFTICIKPGELCLFTDEINSEECLKEDKSLCNLNWACPSQYKYKCVKNTCAKSQEVCKKYKSINDILNYKSKRVTSEAMLKYELFQQKLKACKIYIWKPSMVCVNAVNVCYDKKVVRMRGSFIKVMERIDCDCTGKQYKFKCDDADYCGLDKQACDEFNSAEAKLIKPCDV